MSYRVYVCGDGPECPHDDRFEHRFYFGCVPKTFKDRTGRAKGHRQTLTEVPGLPYQVWMWDGGCDAAGETARRKVAEHSRASRRGTRKIILNITEVDA